jgi:hypothetical protein
MALSSTTLHQQDQWIERAARAGLAAKGLVYSLVGILTFAAAFKLGGNRGNQGNKIQILQWIQDQPFGQILLGLTALGLIGYTIWRLVEAIKDTEHKGNKPKGLANRAVYLFSGLVYGVLSYYAIQMLLGNGNRSGGGNGNARQTVAQKLLEQPFGQWLVGALAVGTMAVGIYQIYRALSEKYRKEIQASQLEPRIQKSLIAAGKLGYIARGIVWIIIGYLFLQAAIQSDPSEAGGTTSVFQYLEKEYGPVILGIIALGLLCYGVFMFVRARYQPIHTR